MKATRRRLGFSCAAAAFLALLGAGVRLSEDGQVGYTHDTSMWIFVASGLFAYYAAIVLFVRLRASRKSSTPSP